MLNNEFKFIGTAITDYEVNGKVSNFTLEVTKQKSGDCYTINLIAYNNSKSINFKESIKGKLVAVIGYIVVDEKGQLQLVVTNLMNFSGNKQNTSYSKAEPVPVVTSQDLESKELVINDDDLPF